MFVVEQVQPGVPDQLVQPGAFRQRRQRGEARPETVADLLRRQPLDTRGAGQGDAQRSGRRQVQAVQFTAAGQRRLFREGSGEPEQAFRTRDRLVCVA